MAAIKKVDEIQVPEGTTAVVEGSMIKITGPKGMLQRDFFNPMLKFGVKDNKILIEKAKQTKREKALVGTARSHLKNMFAGVKDGYVYRLKICSGHFPMNVSISGNEFIIKNFLGESKPRMIKFPKEVKVTITGQDVTVEGISLELVSQTAANIESITKVKNRDKRIFQDGIYITEKAGEVLADKL